MYSDIFLNENDLNENVLNENDLNENVFQGKVTVILKHFSLKPKLIYVIQKANILIVLFTCSS